MPVNIFRSSCSSWPWPQLPAGAREYNLRGKPYYTYCAKYGNATGMRRSTGTGSCGSGCRRRRRRLRPAEPAVVVADPGPPNKPGECYTKVMLPAQYRNEPVQQMVRPAGERSEYTEPVYEEVEEQVMVKPAWKKVTVVPAEYGQVEEKVLVREAYQREIEIPALYNTYFEKTLEKPARQVWKPGRGTVEKVDPNTGEILCLVRGGGGVQDGGAQGARARGQQDLSGRAGRVRHRQEDRGDEAGERPGGRGAGRVRDQQGDQAGEGAGTVKVAVAAEYATVNKQVMVSPEKAEWVQVLCDVNATPEKIQQVEGALKAQGYQLNVDGEIDPELTDSVRSSSRRTACTPTV